MLAEIRNVELDKRKWNEILVADAFFLKQRESLARRKIRDAWLRDFLYGWFDLPEIDSDDVLCFRSLIREDYKRLFHSIINQCSSRKVIVEDYRKKTKSRRINLERSRYIIENQDLYNVLDEPNSFERSCLFIRLCGYKYILDHFASQPRPRLAVFFSDMQPIENLLASYYCSKGVPTVTLQHGLYVDYGNYETVNRINYLHQPSDYFLSWGPNTSSLIKQYHPDTNVVECGKPLIFNADPVQGVKASNKPYVSLLLDQKPFHAQNIEMIEIVREFAKQRGFEVMARFHPSLPKRQILAEYPEIVEQQHFSDAEVIFGHTSSLIYEAIAIGCRVMRYSSDIPAISLPPANEFSTIEELLQRVDVESSEDLAGHYFSAIGQESLLRYKDFFDWILSDKVSAECCDRIGHFTCKLRAGLSSC